MQHWFPQGVLLAVVAVEPAVREVMQMAATQRQTAINPLHMRFVVIDDGNKYRSRPIRHGSQSKVWW
jgi:hypothetical protein